MFEKKFLMILGILALVSFGASMVVSMMLTGPDVPAAGGAAKQPPAGQGTLLAELGAAKAPRTTLARQQQLEELIKDLELRVNEYKRKADRLAQREQRVNLAERNLQRRAEELEKLRTQLIVPLTRLKDAMAELKSVQDAVDKDQKAALVRIAASYERMEPEKGGGILAEMYRGGQEKDVARILYYMSERASAKLLAELGSEHIDPNDAGSRSLAPDLTERMKKIKEQG
jgi:TolA-binding protein